MIVLHVQKVAGISGSEAHLLSLLPQLKERGWDVRFLMLHEHEPGAWDFARELRARGIPLDAIPLAADVDPIAFFRIAGYLGRVRPTILQGTNPRHEIFTTEYFGPILGVHVYDDADWPAILTEVAFVTNQDDANHMRNEKYRQDVAEALLAGITRYQQSLKHTTAPSVAAQAAP